MKTIKILLFLVLFAHLNPAVAEKVSCNTSMLASDQTRVFLNDLNAIQDTIPKQSSMGGSGIDRMLESLLKSRQNLFNLESLAKLYSETKKSENPKKFEKLKDRFKQLEDAIGKYSLAKDIWEKERKEKVSQNAQENLEKTLNEASLELLAVVVIGKWHQEATYEEIKKKIVKISVLSNAQNEKLIRKSIARSIRDLIKKYEKELRPLIMQEHYDFHALEDGLHELRRGVRQIALFVQVFKEHFALSTMDLVQASPEEMEFYKRSKDSPYIVLTEPGNGKTYIPSVAWSQTNSFIYEIGKIKDLGESYYYRNLAAEASGVTRAYVAPRIEKEVQELVNRYFEKKYLEIIATALDKD